MESIAITGSRRMSTVRDTTADIAMERGERSHMTERMLDLTLEIIYLLTGEKYAAVKMTCIEGLLQGMYPPVSEGLGRSQTSIAVPSANSPILKGNMEKIGDITNKLIDLLTGEVPIRNQDVPDCISRENENLEGHKDLYKDTMMEDRPPPTSPDGSSKRSPPKRRPRPLYSRDPTQEDQEIPQDDQGMDQINIKVEIKEEEEDEEEIYVVDGHLSKEEEDFSEIGMDGSNIRRSSMRRPVLTPAYDTDEDNSQESFKMHPVYHSADGSPTPPKPEEFSSNSSNSPTHHSVAGSPASSYPEEFYTNRSHAVTSDIYPRLNEGDGLTDLSISEGSTLGKSDTKSQTSDVSNIPPGPLIPYRPPDPSKAEETSCDKTQTSSPNNIPGLHIGYRPPDPSKAEDTSCEKTQTSSPNNIPGLHIGYRPPVGSNPEESSFSAVKQWAETHEDTLYPCFSSLVKMVEHQRTHGGDQLSQKPAFGDHHKKHQGKKVFPCVECETFFAHSSDLHKHQLRHSREKPFSCSECGKSYTQKSHLVNHQRLHTGENILPCTECGRCFTLKSQFIKHMRTHTGEKPYCCSECGRCFAQKSTLDNHQTIHTGQKPFTCFQCGKHFARKSTLQKHLELHASGVIALKPGP